MSLSAALGHHRRMSPPAVPTAPLLAVRLVEPDAATLAHVAALALSWSEGAADQPGPLPDALLWTARDAAALAALAQRPVLAQAAFNGAVVVLTDAADAALESDLLHMGVQAIVRQGPPADTERALRHAAVRKRVERSARTAYATDLATGLPHEAQLLEHMTQLLALREREPAPLVLIALRVEGYANAAARLGGEAGNVLRRKVAVRLRGGLRASDVVAAIGPDMFGVLLGHLEAAADGERVASKLVRALQQPVVVAGQPCAVAASVGLAISPQHGKEAAALLRRAVAQAGGVATLEGAALAMQGEQARGGAANDG
jgi:diguanylate cyclase (GGDEF)-like protein